MADEKEGELEIEGGGKKNKLVIIIIAVVVVLLGAGGGGFFFFMGGDEPVSEEQAASALDSESGDSESADGEEAPEAATGVQVGSALYVPMPRHFRFNVPGTTRDRFVEIRVQLLVRGSEHEENAKMHIPLIESTLLSTFSQANAEDLATSAGKVALKQKSLAALQKVMMDVEGNNTIEKVLFTGFVMQ
jgi:flagellar FliL protein